MMTTQNLALYLQEVGNNYLRSCDSKSAFSRWRIESVEFMHQKDHENLKLSAKLVPFNESKGYAENYKVGWIRGFAIGILIAGGIALSIWLVAQNG